MSDTEKSTRHAKLHTVVTTHTSHTWAAQLVKLLLQQIAAENTAHATPFLDREKLRRVYGAAGKRLFLFDYDVGFFYLKFFYFLLIRFLYLHTF